MEWPHTVCVATEYGEEVMEPAKDVSVHQGRMNEEEMVRSLFMESTRQWRTLPIPTRWKYRKISGRACERAKIPYIRLLRDGQEKEQEREKENLVYVEDSKEAVKWLEGRQGKIFLTTGSKELPVYVEGLSDPSRIFARVLPSAKVVEGCRELGLEGKQICAMQGPFSMEMNQAMLRQTGASYLVTKDTGKTGGFPEKLQAARNLGIQVIVIQRPAEEGASLEAVQKELERLWQQPSCEEEKETERETRPTLRRRISCIGIGMGDFGTLTLQAREEILKAQILFGAQRMVKAAGSLLERENQEAVLVPEYRGEKIREYLMSHPEFESRHPLFRRCGVLQRGRGIRELFRRIRWSRSAEFLRSIFCFQNSYLLAGREIIQHSWKGGKCNRTDSALAQSISSGKRP